MFSFAAILLVFLCVSGLALGVVTTKPNGRRIGSNTISSNGTTNMAEPVRQPHVRIARQTKNSSARFSENSLAEIAEAVAADEVGRSLFDRGNAVAILCTDRRTREDLLDRLDGPLMTEQEHQPSAETVPVNVNMDDEQAELAQSDHIVIKITPSSSEEKVVMLFIAGSPTIEVEVQQAEGEMKYPRPKVLIFCMADKSAPHVIAENVDVYFLGRGEARLSVVDGSARMFGRGSVSGVDSQIALYGDQTVSIGGLRCIIHTFNPLQIMSGRENTGNSPVFHRRASA